ncbi:MAG TPA: efflux RND transporter periplasmic adaptor subunit [Steroidobacteraceae bacterium]|nr:efflux RND transporter periplasmic adaptor subunit [Steroidobacteraceae bacterium]
MAIPQPNTPPPAAPDKGALLHQLRIDRGLREETAEVRRWPWVVGGALLLVLIGAGLWLMKAGHTAVAVHTAMAQPMTSGGPSTSVLDATGYVTARRQATVSAQITGKLSEVLIEEGDHVQAGQVLGRLDDTSQRAALAQAEAQFHSAQALLVQFQAQLAQDQRDVKRAEDLVQRKLVSEQAVEQARTLVDTQGAMLEQQRKQIDVAAANVRSAQVQLDYCTVRSPFAGVVIAKAAQVGEIVSPLSAGGGFTRTGIGTLVDMESLEIEVDVNEAYINRVLPKQPVASVLNAYPDWKIPSHVIAIIPTADRAKATVKVRIGLDLKDDRIVPDMGVRVSFLEEQKPVEQDSRPPRGVLVPTAALRKEGDKDVVFVVKDGKAQRRTVTLGGSFGNSRQVESGVSPGEAVIVDAPAELKDDAAVSAASP